MQSVSNLTSKLGRVMALSIISANLAACGAADRLKTIGVAPPLSPIESPTTQAGYRPVQMPMPAPDPAVFKSNSLWRSGARGFFKDQRAARIGDILTVQVKIADEAKIDNTTARSRTAAESAGIDSVAGFEKWAAAKILPQAANLADLVGADSSTSTNGTGSISRNEDVTTNVAAVVTQVLPNGNLVIEGKQEVRVNFEVRELVVAGIVRPEDIGADNTIESAKIAEARIAYGGRGQITDMQQPRYGQQVLDVLLPF